jgi:hypothetical protein
MRGAGSGLGYHFSMLVGGQYVARGSLRKRFGVGGIAAAFFLDKPHGTWTKIGIAIAGLVLGWVCYSIASNILTYMHTAPEQRR